MTICSLTIAVNLHFAKFPKIACLFDEKGLRPLRYISTPTGFSSFRVFLITHTSVLSGTYRKLKSIEARLLLQESSKVLVSHLLTLNLLGAQFLLGEDSGVRVQSQHNLLVLQWVLLQDMRSLGVSVLGRSNDSLDLGRVDQRLEVSVGDNVGWQGVANLGRLSGLRTVDSVQRLESSLGPDDKSTQVSTRGQLQQAQTGHVSEVDTRDVSESRGKTVVVGVNHQWTLSLGESSVSQLTLTSTDLLGLDHADDVLVGTNSLQDGNGVLGLGNGLEVVGHNQWQLSNLLNSVASGQHQGGDGGSSNGGSGGVTLLVLVHSHVPSSPGLGRGEHTTTSTHVTESGLAGTVGTTTTNSWNSGNSTTSTPGLSRGLVTSLGGNSVSLSLVLVDSGEHRVHNVGSHWGSENSRQRQLGGGLLAGGGDNGDLRTRHFECDEEKEERADENFLQHFFSPPQCARMLLT